MQASQDHSESIAEALEHMHPELAPVREAGGEPVYLVGGAVRDLLLGRGRADIDLVVEGDAAALAERLGAEVTSHERFGTAKVKLDGHEVDIAGARSESYPQPGALPVVGPGPASRPTCAAATSRSTRWRSRCGASRGLIDPHGGEADLAARQLRVLHDDSFVDDPTRAIRAARYASRFGFELEEHTAELIAPGRSGHGLGRPARGRAAAPRCRRERREGFALLAEWGLVELRRRGGRAGRADGRAARQRAMAGLRAARSRPARRGAGPPRGEVALAAAEPERPSEAVALAAPHDGIELVLARALGAEWLDRYVGEWRDVALEIDGSDLIASRPQPGPGAGPRLGGGVAAQARRRDRRPRGGAGGGAGGGEERRWSGVSKTACAGSRRPCREGRPPSPPARSVRRGRASRPWRPWASTRRRSSAPGRCTARTSPSTTVALSRRRPTAT